MKFRTAITQQPSPHKIGLKTGIVTIGSCFSDVLGDYLLSNKCNCLSNPYGTTYNMVSIAGQLMTALTDKEIGKERLVKHSNRFFHYDYHSSFYDQDEEGLLNRLNRLNQSTSEALKSCGYLIITLGTSWVYALKDANAVVSNCHKQHAGLFDKKFLDLSSQKKAFTAIREQLLIHNPNIKIILTVSPVRHIKDTLTLNSASKAALRVLCHELEDSFEEVSYFPSYEIMMDDLRDYRFYKADLIHPNEMAEAYILEHFSDTWFDTGLKDFIKTWSVVKSALDHRPFDPEGPAHQAFLRKTLDKLLELHKKASMFTEIEMLRQQIVSDFS